MLKDLVFKNRSYRGFNEERKITREELKGLVELARLCPSSVNNQPLKYKLVYEESEVLKLRQEVKWARALPHLQLPHEGMQPTGFIVICLDENISTEVVKFQKDVGIVAQTMLLGAVELGLGGCMIGNFVPSKVMEVLELGSNFKPMLVVALGEPKEEVVIVEVENGESTTYYRDENDVHFVPKRKLEDILI